MPNVGPIEGWRIATVARLPMWPSASPRPTVVVVLPSPSGVGVMAETTTYFAFGRSLSSSIASSLTLATSCPCGSSKCGPIPILPRCRTWAEGVPCARCRGQSEIQPSCTLSLRKARQHLAPPSLRRLDLVECEHVESGDAPGVLCDVREQRAHESAGLVSARPKHSRQPAGLAAPQTGQLRHPDLDGPPQQPCGVGHTSHPDVDRQLDPTPPHPLHPPLHG